MRMKRITVVILAMITMTPVGAGAIVVSTSASSQSGGVTADQHETVVTGSSQSSSRIQTTIISDERGGTADVQITNTTDGVQRVEKKKYEIPAGGAVEIRSATPSTMKARALASSTVTAATTTHYSNATTSRVGATNMFIAWLNQAPWRLSIIYGRFMSFFF